MANERLVKLIHLPLFAFLALVSLIWMAIGASLVAHWNQYGYPTTSIRDRSRICLVAGIYMSFFALYFLFGVIFAAASIAFGIFVHLIALGIGFILSMIGAATITASVRNVNCSRAPGFDRCGVTKGLEGMGWVVVVFTFIALVFVLVLGIKARSGAGMRRGNLVNA